MQGKSIDQSKLYFGLKITCVGGDGEEIILESKNLNDVIFSLDMVGGWIALFNFRYE